MEYKYTISESVKKKKKKKKNLKSFIYFNERCVVFLHLSLEYDFKV